MKLCPIARHGSGYCARVNRSFRSPTSRFRILPSSWRYVCGKELTCSELDGERVAAYLLVCRRRACCFLNERRLLAHGFIDDCALVQHDRIRARDEREIAFTVELSSTREGDTLAVQDALRELLTFDDDQLLRRERIVAMPGDNVPLEL